MSISCRSSWLLTKGQNQFYIKALFQYFQQTRFYLMLPFQCLMETDLYKLLKTQRLSNDHICYFLYQVDCVSWWGWWCMIPCYAITHSKCWLDRCCSVYKKNSKTNTKRCNSCNFWSAKISQIWLDLLAVQNLFLRKPSGRYISCEAGWISTINFFSLRPNKFSSWAKYKYSYIYTECMLGNLSKTF